MTMNDPTDCDTGAVEDQQHSAARKNRGGRALDPEWEEVGGAAQDQGITSAELVRDRILKFVRNPEAAESISVRGDIVPLVERTTRYTSMLARRMRDEMLGDGKGEDLDLLVDEARKLQVSSLTGTPE